MKQDKFFGMSPVYVFLEGTTVLGYVLDAGDVGFQFVDSKFSDYLVVFTHNDMCSVVGYAKEYLAV